MPTKSTVGVLRLEFLARHFDEVPFEFLEEISERASSDLVKMALIGRSRKTVRAICFFKSFIFGFRAKDKCFVGSY